MHLNKQIASQTAIACTDDFDFAHTAHEPEVFPSESDCELTKPVNGFHDFDHRYWTSETKDYTSNNSTSSTKPIDAPIASLNIDCG